MSRISAAVLVVALLGTLVSCGSSSGSDPADAGNGAFPVRITHAYGRTTVPAQPKRVVAIGFNDTDFALALGVVPVGTREYLGGFDWQRRPWAQEALGGTQPEKVGGAELNLEKIAALDPDLILGVYSFIDEHTYTVLSKIAPTIAQPTPDGTDAATWQEQTRITGKALGRTDRAEHVIAATQAAFARARRAHPDFVGTTLSMDFVVAGVPYKLGTDDLRAQLFAGLGFTVPDKTRKLSAEQQGRLNAGLITVMGRSRKDTQADPVFGAIPAARAGRVAYLGNYTTQFAGALGYSSPLSLPYAIDAVVPELAATLR